eukprot:PhM_4_TR7851/c0_g1_i1/m.8366/K14442/DHX36, RHAU; ATP-dependent RNA helicase DHX36
MAQRRNGGYRGQGGGYGYQQNNNNNNYNNNNNFGYVAAIQQQQMQQPSFTAQQRNDAWMSIARAGFRCEGCGMNFNDADSLAAHKTSTRHGQWYRCTACRHEMYYCDARILQYHMTFDHNIMTPMTPARQQQQQQQQQPPRGGGGGGRGNSTNRRAYDVIIKEFVEDDSQDTLVLRSLSALERSTVHKLAAHYKVHHKSSGPQNDRVLTLSKIAKAHYEGDSEVRPLSAGPLLDHKASVDPLLAEVTRLLRCQYLHEIRELKRPRRMRAGAMCGFKECNNKGTVMSAQEAEEVKRFRHDLPAYQAFPEVLDALRRSQVVIVSGETGCGKSTQIPAMLVDAPGVLKKDEVVVVTQPRRISTIALADRVAYERNQQVGNEVGYQIRFEGLASRNTRLLFVTTGILLRRMHADQGLKGVGVVVVDEIHERDKDTDVCLIFLRDILRLRPDIKIVLMSATLQIEKLQKYFITGPRPPPVVSIRGRMFDVTPYFLEDAHSWVSGGVAPARKAPKGTVSPITSVDNDTPTTTTSPPSATNSKELTMSDITLRADAIRDEDEDAVIPYDLIADLIERYHQTYPMENAVLVFLPGWGQIHKLVETIQKRKPAAARQMSILPLHSQLTTQQQRRVFPRPPRNFRKIVISTNIAETSVTIDDVVLVIDSCLSREKSYNVSQGVSRLHTTQIARASAMQRRGRAGRCAPGECIHLISKREFEALQPHTVPEVCRTPLEELCLQMKTLGDARAILKAMDAPEESAVDAAIAHLMDMGAIDRQSNELTNLGHMLALMPVHPVLGKMLIYSSMFGVLDDIAVICASLSGKSPFVKPLANQKQEYTAHRRRLDDGMRSDHFVLLRVYRDWVRRPAGHSRNDYCYDNFLDPSTMNSIFKTKRQFIDLLVRSGFVEADGQQQKKQQHGTLSWANRYCGNWGLVQFVFANTVYPTVASIERERAKHGKKHLTFVTVDNKPAYMHPSSVNEGLTVANCTFGDYVFYFDRMKIETTVYLFDTTVVSALMLLLSSSSPVTALGEDEAADMLAAHDTEREFLLNPEAAAFEARLKQQLHADGTPLTTSVLQCEEMPQKRYSTSSEIALSIATIRDAVAFFSRLSFLHVCASKFPDVVVRLVAYAVGFPVKESSSEWLAGGLTESDFDTSDITNTVMSLHRGRSGLLPEDDSDDDNDDNNKNDNDNPKQNSTVEVIEVTDEEWDYMRNQFGPLPTVDENVRPKTGSGGVVEQQKEKDGEDEDEDDDDDIIVVAVNPSQMMGGI